MPKGECTTFEAVEGLGLDLPTLRQLAAAETAIMRCTDNLAREIAGQRHFALTRIIEALEKGH